MNAINPTHLSMIASLSRLHYRRVVSGPELEKIGALRQRAYDSKTVFAEKLGEPLVENDDANNGFYTFGLYEDDDILATVRFGVLDKSNPRTQAAGLFPEVLSPLVAQGQRFIDPSRLAVEPTAADTFPALPVFILRTAFIATVHFSANQCLSVVKREHEAFYRRVFSSTRLAGPAKPAEYAIDLLLLGSALSNEQKIQSRYPIFHFTDAEREALFADLPAGEGASDPVVPSAAQVMGLDVSAIPEMLAARVA
ncbi:MAG: hypothetical protein AAFY99_10625 [Pseudomonadota bacterium]